MASPITIILKPATDITPDELTDCYALIARTGFRFPPGVIESVHLRHNPTILLGYQDDQLVGFQSHSLYWLQTPFRRRKMPLIYGGLGYQDVGAGRQGIAHRMVVHYMRHVLGPFWSLRSYTSMIGTHTPRLIQILGMQHQLYLPHNNTLTPSLVHFIHDFVRQKRSNHFPMNDQLVVSPPSDVRPRAEITDQWSELYRSTHEELNQLAHDLKLVEEVDGRRYLVGKFLMVLGRSSRSRLLKASWTYGSKWLRNRFRLAGR